MSSIISGQVSADQRRGAPRRPSLGETEATGLIWIQMHTCTCTHAPPLFHPHTHILKVVPVDQTVGWRVGSVDHTQLLSSLRLTDFQGAAVTSSCSTVTLHISTAKILMLGLFLGPDYLIGMCSSESAVLWCWQEWMHGCVHDQHDQRRKSRSWHIITTHF